MFGSPLLRVLWIWTDRSVGQGYALSGVPLDPLVGGGVPGGGGGGACQKKQFKRRAAAGTVTLGAGTGHFASRRAHTSVLDGGAIIIHTATVFVFREIRSDGEGGGRGDALEGEGPQRRLGRRLGRRLAEVAEAVGGGYCRLQVPLRLALGVRGTVAGRR